MKTSTTNQINTWLIAETLFVFLIISTAAVYIQQLPLSTGLRWTIYAPLLLFQGLWFYRFYIVGHEASHKKLFPDSQLKNDFWAGVILLPLMTPIAVYRKIHQFHHGFNRKDEHTSNLDTYTSNKRPNVFTKAYYYFIWYVSVFCGGFFIYSMISVLLFILVPPSISIKISPAFKGWKAKDQLKSLSLFMLGLVLHLTVFYVGGKNIYLYTLGYPMIAFAWILSILVYIFHYDTTVGDEVRYNVRSLRRVPVLSWVLMNFNEHSTHHQYPNIPWHELPQKKSPLPEMFLQQNQNTWNMMRAIANQLKGPQIIFKHEDAKSR